jgi:purine nucleoside permease
MKKEIKGVNMKTILRIFFAALMLAALCLPAFARPVSDINAGGGSSVGTSGGSAGRSAYGSADGSGLYSSPASGSASTSSTSSASSGSGIPIKALLLPKFEAGNMSGDFPGEAQYYYEAYCKGGQEYAIEGGFEDHRLYVKDGVAIYVTGMGKVNSSNSLTALLLDKRFDWSKTWIISTGCAGGVRELTVMGDVVIASAAADFDLGHHADPRELPPGQQTWFHDGGYDSASFHQLNLRAVDRAYALTRNIPLSTTGKTQAVMALTFPGEAWAIRNPRVLVGTVVSGDNYWKGLYGEATAKYIVQTYGARDPYMLTEMEDVALATVAKRFGKLDRYLIIRDSVNMDVFMAGWTPMELWAPDLVDDTLASEDNAESADIFRLAMENNFKVGKVIVDAILGGIY